MHSNAEMDATYEDGDGEGATGMSVKDQLGAIIGRLEGEANKRVGLRHEVEQRWLDDLRQYHGVYDEETRAQLDDADGSKVFVNYTRPKTNGMTARLYDLLFPTDDRNWSIEPTPVPELERDVEAKIRAMHEADKQDDKARQKAENESLPPEERAQMQAEADKAHSVAEALAAEIGIANKVREKAKKNCDMMQREIDDQLKGCNYQAHCRDVIEDGCKIGIGVLFGPIQGQKARRAWRPNKDGTYELYYREETDPAVQWIDPWSFFPDPSVRRVQDGEGTYLRHMFSKQELKKLAREPHFDKDALRRLLVNGNRTQAPSYLNDLRNIGGETTSIEDNSYHVWQYIGPLEPEDIAAIKAALDPEGTDETIPDPDPLEDIQAVVWFCQGEILKFALHPLDSGEPMFSVFNLEKDETSVYGFGVPYLIRDEQRVINAAWRMMMDNGAVASGPQILVNKSKVKPDNGVWEFAPRKIWVSDDDWPQSSPPFQVFNVDMNQGDLAGIIEIARGQVDDVTSMPAIAQGEQGAGITKTAQGMAILMNSANVVFRRVVKNFDDDVTTPTIRRLYDWNMQFSKKDSIKGDFEVVARGSSVLLVREMQATNLMTLAMNFAQHPDFGPRMKKEQMLRDIFSAHMLSADDHVMTEDEYEDEQAKQAEIAAQTAAQDPAIARVEMEREIRIKELDAKVAIAQMETATRTKAAELNYEATLMKLAQDEAMTMEQLAAKARELRMKIQADERQIAVETAVTERIGATGGGLY